MRVVEISEQRFDDLINYVKQQRMLYNVPGFINRKVLKAQHIKCFIAENSDKSIRGFVILSTSKKRYLPIKLVFCWCSDEKSAKELGKFLKTFLRNTRRESIIAKAAKGSSFNYWFSWMGMDLIDQIYGNKKEMNIWAIFR